MVRLLKYLSVFLISMVFLFDGSVANATEISTKEDYEYLYSCIKEDGSFSGRVGQLADKDFGISYESLQLRGFACEGPFRTFGYGGTTFVVHDSINYSDSNTESDGIFISFRDNPDGNFNFYLKVQSGKLKYLPLEQWKFYPKDEKTEEKPSITPPFNSDNIVPPSIDVGDGSADGVIDGIVNVIADFFKELSKNGIRIIKSAIAIGVIFIGGKWLWRKVRQWLNSV